MPETGKESRNGRSYRDWSFKRLRAGAWKFLRRIKELAGRIGQPLGPTMHRVSTWLPLARQLLRLGDLGGRHHSSQMIAVGERPGVALRSRSAPRPRP